ncbi:MAG: hypothetical protein LBJ72_13115 [Dysgonamonadaceae bacterium]|jgi:hypothetical protein|nr:hypothetical protein [Dysgonamonadaceae bacterium]
MKKNLILFLASICACLNLSAQCPPHFKPVEEFNKDVVSYLVYNFGDENGKAFHGKTVDEVIQCMGLQINFFGIGIDTKNNTDRIRYISLRLYDEKNDYFYRQNKIDAPCFSIYFVDLIPSGEVMKQRRANGGGKWTPELEALFKDIVVDYTRAFYSYK